MLKYLTINFNLSSICWDINEGLLCLLIKIGLIKNNLGGSDINSEKSGINSIETT
jgi:hypothetical protein